MTVKELIEFLETQSPDARVLAYDPLAERTEDIAAYVGYASYCFNKLFPVGCKKEAEELAKQKSEEEELFSGTPLTEFENEVFYCVAFAPFYDPEIKEIVEKRAEDSGSDLLLKSYIEHPVLPLHFPDEYHAVEMNIIMQMQEDEFNDFLARLKDGKTIRDILIEMGYKLDEDEKDENGISDEQQEEV